MSDRLWAIRVRGKGDVEAAGVVAKQLIKELLEENQTISAASFQDVASGKEHVNLLVESSTSKDDDD